MSYNIKIKLFQATLAILTGFGYAVYEQATMVVG